MLSTRWLLVQTRATEPGRGADVSETTVVHNVREAFDVYIGRDVPEHGIVGSKWGNPFVMTDDSETERERVIAAYRDWIVTQPGLMSSLEELRGRRLGCWCAPERCHGDVLVELLEAGETLPVST